MASTLIARLKLRAKELKRDTYALYLACRDPRVPWHVRALAVCVVTYVLSPIDLIPDFIPVLGYADDLVIVPFGVALIVRMIPDDVLTECREKAQRLLSDRKPRSWLGAVIILCIWIVLASLVFRAVWRYVRPPEPFGEMPFNSKAWRAMKVFRNREGRAKMAQDLIDHYLQPGMPVTEITSLLGTHDKTWPATEYSPHLNHDVYEYDMGYAPMDFAGQHYVLRLYFDGKSNYERAETMRD